MSQAQQQQSCGVPSAAQSPLGQAPAAHTVQPPAVAMQHHALTVPPPSGHSYAPVPHKSTFKATLLSCLRGGQLPQRLLSALLFGLLALTLCSIAWYRPAYNVTAQQTIVRPFTSTRCEVEASLSLRDTPAFSYYSYGPTQQWDKNTVVTLAKAGNVLTGVAWFFSLLMVVHAAALARTIKLQPLQQCMALLLTALLYLTSGALLLSAACLGMSRSETAMSAENFYGYGGSMMIGSSGYGAVQSVQWSQVKVKADEAAILQWIAAACCVLAGCMYLFGIWRKSNERPGAVSAVAAGLVKEAEAAAASADADASQPPSEFDAKWTDFCTAERVSQRPLFGSIVGLAIWLIALIAVTRCEILSGADVVSEQRGAVTLYMSIIGMIAAFFAWLPSLAAALQSRCSRDYSIHYLRLLASLYICSTIFFTLAPVSMIIKARYYDLSYYSRPATGAILLWVVATLALTFAVHAFVVYRGVVRGRMVGAMSVGMLTIPGAAPVMQQQLMAVPQTTVMPPAYSQVYAAALSAPAAEAAGALPTGALIYCGQCGAGNPNNCRFCIACGRPLVRLPVLGAADATVLVSASAPPAEECQASADAFAAPVKIHTEPSA